MKLTLDSVMNDSTKSKQSRRQTLGGKLILGAIMTLLTAVVNIFLGIINPMTFVAIVQLALLITGVVTGVIGLIVLVCGITVLFK